MKHLYIIDYENAHWCGGQLNCLVWADSPDDAVDRASDYMEESQRELFSDHYEDENDYDDESAYTVNAVELMDCAHSEWEFFMDPTQAEFYPIIN